MDSRALLRRAFPYLVIGIGGFALAYVIIFVFVLPAKIVPPPEQPYAPASPRVLQPIDTSVVSLPPDTGFSRAVVPMGGAPESAPDLGPTDVPDLVGMALADARAVLNSYRLQASVQRDTSSFQPPNTVLRQSPDAGQRIASGGTVTLTVSYFPPTTPAAPVESTGVDSVRRVPRRPLPPIIPMDSAPPPRRDSTMSPASARFPG